MDAIASLIIVVLILMGTWKLILNSIRMLIDSVPEHLNYEQIRDALKNLDHVLDVHDLHIWSMGQNESALSVHLMLTEDCTDTQHWDLCLKSTQDMLAEKFQINHSTLQVEPHDFPKHKNCT